MINAGGIVVCAKTHREISSLLRLGTRRANATKDYSAKPLFSSVLDNVLW